LQCTWTNQEGKTVAKGEAQVAAPTEKETVTAGIVLAAAGDSAARGGLLAALEGLTEHH
jgi:hypothetical protein